MTRPKVALFAVAFLAAASLAFGATASVAFADPIVVLPAQIELDAAWVGDPPATEGSPLLIRKNGAAVLTVTKAIAGNTAAWRSATRDKYIDEVEAGLLAAGGGAEKVSSKRSKVGRDNVPVLDLLMRRKRPDGAKEVVAVRVLLFRTVTVAAAAAAPDTRSGRKLAEGAVVALIPR